MKTDTTILKLLLLCTCIALCFEMVSCDLMNKGSDEHPTVKLVIGQMYTVKSGIFNKGAYQPVSPVRLDSLFIDNTGIHWAKINARQQGEKIGSTYDPAEFVEWQIPQSDLK